MLRRIRGVCHVCRGRKRPADADMAVEVQHWRFIAVDVIVAAEVVMLAEDNSVQAVSCAGCLLACGTGSGTRGGVYV